MIYEYGKTRLSPTEASYYDKLIAGWMNKQKRIQISNAPIPQETMEPILFSATRDHPEIFWIDDHRFSYETGPFGSFVETELTFKDHEISMLQAEAERWKQSIVSSVPSHFSVDDKIWLLYDYLARQVVYESQQIRYSHTIIGVLQRHRHKAVCEGIAKAFKYLCDSLDMPSIFIVGNVDFGPNHCGPHAWNMAYSSQGPRHLDITAQLLQAKIQGKASRDNFLHFSRDMKQYSWNIHDYPIA